MKVYLSGGMHSGWQDTATDEFAVGITVLNPRQHGLSAPEQYSAWDREAIKQCDVVLAYMENSNPCGKSLGFEVGYAKGLGKLVVLVDETKHRYMDLIRHSVDVECDSIGDAAMFINRLSRCAADWRDV